MHPDHFNELELFINLYENMSTSFFDYYTKKLIKAFKKIDVGGLANAEFQFLKMYDVLYLFKS